jgi:hypothetical protein
MPGSQVEATAAALEQVIKFPKWFPFFQGHDHHFDGQEDSSDLAVASCLAAQFSPGFASTKLHMPA